MFEHNLVADDQVTKKEGSDVHLRSVDLNLLTVFDAVMQMHNVTRAAQSLGMSQPAVSNAVARLKVMFNDELFVRSLWPRYSAYLQGSSVVWAGEASPAISSK